MQALIWDGNQLGVEDGIELRPVAPGEVEVEIAAAGLCHSDLKPIEGQIASPLPLILGHEASGVITAIGGGDRDGVWLGAKVVLSPVQSCGNCRACRSGRPTRCAIGAPEFAPPFHRDGAVVHQFVRLGAFAQRIVVRREQVVIVPDELPDTVAALLGCAVVTGFGAVRERARIEPGDAALVIGAGGIGLNVIQACRLSGAEQIVVLDTNPRKRELATELGATDFQVIEPDAEVAAIAAIAREIRPSGFDAAFECVGLASLVEAAVASLARGGRAVIVGLPGTDVRMTLPVRSLFFDQSLLGCRMGGVDAHRLIPELARDYLDGRLVLDPLVTKVVGLDQGAALVAEMQAGQLDRGLFDIARLGEETNAR